MRQHKVLLISSHDFGWGELRRALQAMEGVSLVGEATTMCLALHLATTRRPDVVIAAATLEGRSVQPLLMDLRRTLCPALKVILFASHLEPAEAMALGRLQPDGYLLWSDLSPDTLPHYLTLAIGGDIVLRSRTVATFLATQCEAPQRGRGAAQLTAREQAVLQRLAAGLTHKQIARVESLSLRTVERTVTALEAKVDAPNHFVLGLKAAQLGLLG